MEWALLTPVILLIILLCIQFLMVYHANHIALAAAQAGSRAAREAGPGAGWEGIGDEAARNTVAQLGPGVLDVTAVQGYGDGVYDRGFEVRGIAKTVIPGMTFEVVKRAVGPVECFRPDVGEAKVCEAAP